MLWKAKKLAETGKKIFITNDLHDIIGTNGNSTEVTCMKERINAYMYTRVSTEMQVDGYSLEAQEQEIKDYACKNNINIVAKYTDEGKSGKSIEKRDGFQQMLNDIKADKDNVKYVIAFKLSRIGRNASDVLNANQILKDYGVYIICIKDGINTENANSSLILSVMASVAEMERETIITQTMAGRMQKARDGKWNGGQSPYGYRLENEVLYIDEAEASTVRIIFDKYINTNMGYVGVSNYLNRQGIVRITRGNTKISYWTEDIVYNILTNPVYIGKIAYGRTKSELVRGSHSKTRRVANKDYMLYEGLHEAIVSEEDFNRAQDKVKRNAVKTMRKHDLEHEHLLSTLIKCPLCGRGMYGNVNRKKKKLPDGTYEYYKSYFYYQCDYSKARHNHECAYKNQISEDVVHEAVETAVLSMMQDSYRVEKIRKQLNKSIDTETLQANLDSAKATQEKLMKRKDRYNREIGELDEDDKFYDAKLSDLRKQIDKIYEDLDKSGLAVQKAEEALASARLNEASVENVVKMMRALTDNYYDATQKERKILLQSLIKYVEIYQEPDEYGQIIKRIVYNFPIYVDDMDDNGKSWDEADTVEALVLLSYAL